MVFTRKIATRLQPYHGYRSATRLVLSARALRSAATPFDKASPLRAFRTMMAQFASREVAGLSVRLVVRYEGNTVLDCRRETDAEGFVHFDEALDREVPLPVRTEWQVATLEWLNADGPQKIEANILSPGSDGKLGIISDIDDTIVESGITGGLGNVMRNWQRVLAQMPGERTVVPGAVEFYTGLGGEAFAVNPDALPAPSRPFFYVSSSPWNIFSYIVAFQRLHNMPLGPLLLRDWGFNRDTFGSGSHGSHKVAAIGSIMSSFPEMRFAMIGDDTQGDLPAFAEAAAAHPGQVAGVFLRKAAVEDFSAEELAGKAILEAGNIPLWVGDSFATAADFLSEMGIGLHGETAKIVETIEEKGDAPATDDA